MTDRVTIEQALRGIYAARCEGDADAICKAFCNSVHFELAGSSDASPIAARVSGAAAFRQLLDRLIEIFEVSDHEILAMVIEGERAAVRWRAKVRSTVTGESANTELFDFVEFKDGQIVSFVEQCDTAMAARMMTSISQQATAASATA